jgi:hypothetical protein
MHPRCRQVTALLVSDADDVLNEFCGAWRGVPGRADRQQGCMRSCAEYLSVRARLTANILWAPTPARALALAATVGPWLALAGVTVARRRGSGRAAAAGGSAP